MPGATSFPTRVTSQDHNVLQKAPWGFFCFTLNGHALSSASQEIMDPQVCCVSDKMCSELVKQAAVFSVVKGLCKVCYNHLSVGPLSYFFRISSVKLNSCVITCVKAYQTKHLDMQTASTSICDRTD